MCRKAYDFSERMDLKDLQKICQAEVINDKDWKCISKHQQLSEDFIREFADKVYWDYISARQQLSEDFMREFADKVDWKCISIFQHLSEAFIREFADKVDWDCISKYQHLSEDFIQEFKDKVDLNSINNSWCKLDVKEKKLKLLKLAYMNATMITLLHIKVFAKTAIVVLISSINTSRMKLMKHLLIILITRIHLDSPYGRMRMQKIIVQI